MRHIYANILLTIIAICLLAVVAKLYVPEADNIGPRFTLPTRGDILALKTLPEGVDRKQAYAE